MKLFQAFGQFAGSGARVAVGIYTITPTSVASDGSASISGNGLVTFSSTDTLNINGVFTSEYVNYLYEIRWAPTIAGDINLRLRVGGVDNSTASSYVRQQLFADNTSVGGNRVTGNLLRVATGGTVASNYASGIIVGPFLAATTAFRTDNYRSQANGILHAYSGTHNQSTSYDGFTLTTGGAETIDGELMVYGLVS